MKAKTKRQRNKEYYVYLSEQKTKDEQALGSPVFYSYEEAKEYCTAMNEKLIREEGIPGRAPFKFYYVNTQGYIPFDKF